MEGTDLSHSPYHLLTGRYSNCEDCDANWKQRPLKIKVCTFSNVLISVFTLKDNILQLGISVQTMGDCSNLLATKAITRRFFCQLISKLSNWCVTYSYTNHLLNSKGCEASETVLYVNILSAYMARNWPIVTRDPKKPAQNKKTPVAIMLCGLWSIDGFS